MLFATQLLDPTHVILRFSNVFANISVQLLNSPALLEKLLKKAWRGRITRTTCFFEKREIIPDIIEAIGALPDNPHRNHLLSGSSLAVFCNILEKYYRWDKTTTDFICNYLRKHTTNKMIQYFINRAFNEKNYDFLQFLVNTFPTFEVPLKVAFELACQKKDDNDTFTRAMEKSKLSTVRFVLYKYLICRRPELSKKIICRDPQLFVEYFDSSLIELKIGEYVGNREDLLDEACSERQYELIEYILRRNPELNVKPNLMDYTIYQIYNQLNRNPPCNLGGAFMIRKDIVLKKFEHDKYLDRLTVFIPYLKVKAPQFYMLVINDKSTLMKMTDKDIKIVQDIVDYLIYGNYTFINNLDSCYMKVLTILLMVEDQALKEVIMKCCDMCKENTKPSNVIANLNLFSKKNMRTTWSESLRLYLLDYIRGSDLISEILTQEGAQEYSEEIIKRKGLSITNIINYTDYYMPSLPKEITGFDIEIRTFNKTFQVYKTVLMSQSTFFYALLNSNNWNSEQYLDNITEYVIEYCYGLYLFPKDAGDAIEIIKTAHYHEIPQMIAGFSDFVRVDKSNFKDLSYLLTNLQFEFYQPLNGLIEKMVNYAFTNYATYTSFEIERLPPCVIYPLMDKIIKERKRIEDLRFSE